MSSRAVRRPLDKLKIKQHTAALEKDKNAEYIVFGFHASFTRPASQLRFMLISKTACIEFVGHN
jgi:hypothetical protein